MSGKLKPSVKSICCPGNITLVPGNKISLLTVGNYVHVHGLATLLKAMNLMIETLKLSSQDGSVEKSG